MQTITSSKEMLEFTSKFRSDGLSIGFVPTMGSLHEGHISLIEASKRENDVTICSVFVNPTQFNDPSDFDKYPRNLEADLLLLDKNGCDIAFTPSVDEVYPKSDLEVYKLGEISEILEGTKRPGHFNGMASVVKRLFELTKPHSAYFGLKDYQQCLVVIALVKNYSIPIEIVSCPILREPSGLALSSRNERLSESGKQTATHIEKCLQIIKKTEPINNIAAALKLGNDYLSGVKNLEVEYLEIRDAATLDDPNAEITNEVVVLVAAWLEGVRLIDNMTMAFNKTPNE